jgi:hypothetical protein
MLLFLVAFLAAAELTIPFDSSPAARTVRLSLDGAPPWPVETTLRLLDTDTGAAFTRTLTPAEAGELRAVAVPPGRYNVEVVAKHHRPALRKLVVPRGENVALGEIRLAAAAVARGVVRRGDGTPLAGAIVRAEGSELARTNARGEFAAEIPEPRPPALLVTARALGTKVIALPRGDVDVAVPPLTMSPASSAVITIVREPGDVDVTLQRWDDSDGRIDVARRHVAADAAAVAFDDLEAGTYVLIVRGSGPFAVAAMKVNVGSGERRRATMTIHPEPVDWTASFAGKPLLRTTLAFTNTAFRWRAEVKTDDTGRFAGVLWQPGPALVSATGGALKAPYSESAELRGGHFDFVVPDRQVRGRVLDAASGRGVPGALVFLRTSHGDLKSNPRTTTDDNGAFLFNAVAPGEQHLTVLAGSYLIPSPVDFTTKEGDPPRQVDVALETGTPRALRVFTHDGRPAAGAELDAVVGGDIRAISGTDAEGRGAVPLPPEGEAKIYVVPREGAFAVVSARDPDRVQLPPPSSSLRIVTRSTDGAPLAQVELLMSFNGTVIPPAVARRIGKMQGLALMTGSDGEVVLRNIPPGWYQFWPYRGDDEAQAILMASPMEAPIALNVKSGENAVEVDFQKRMQ